jgi:hypothetical protein
MATITHVSTPASGAVAIYELLTLLLAAGWRVTRWSDATTYTDATGAPLATNPYGSGASGAGNLGNTSAWFTVRASDSSREWLFERNANDAQWTINRSKAGFITGGAATVLPTATDTAGSALFTAGTVFTGTPGRLFISADDTSGYGWRLMVMVTGGGDVRTLVMDEPLTSADPADTDPYLWVGFGPQFGGLNTTGASQASNDTAVFLIYKRFTGAGSNHRVVFLTSNISPSLQNAIAAPPVGTSCGGLPSNLSEVPFPVPVVLTGAPSSTTGWCGYASGIRWSTVQGRANGQTLDGSPAYWIYAAGLWLPWDSSAPALS